MTPNDSAHDASNASYSEGSLPSSRDGTALFVRRWQPAALPPRGQVLVIHGYMEHSGRYAEVARRLCLAGLSVLAFDLRGHGRAAGQRGYVRDFDAYLDDIDAAYAALPEANLARFVLGHSQGALLALDWLQHRRPQLTGCVLTNPYLRLALQPPALKVAAGNLAARLLPRLSLPSGLLSSQLSRVPEMVAAHRQDPLVFGHANAAWFAAVQRAQARVLAISELGVPLLYIFSDADPVADAATSRRFAAQLRAPDKEIWERPGELHEVLNERDRVALHGAIAAWMQARC